MRLASFNGATPGSETKVIHVERNRWISDLHWVRTGQQTRSQRTQQALLDAAEELFGIHGVDGTSVVDIASTAGCSVGAVYHHFSDKKAVLYALFDRLAEEFEATTRDAVDPERWGGATVGDILYGYVEFSLENTRRRPGFRSSSALEAAREDPALAGQYRKLQSGLDDGLHALLIARRHQIGHPDPELAIRYVLEQLGAVLHLRLRGETLDTRFGKQPDEVFLAETMRSACGYLGVELPEQLR